MRKYALLAIPLVACAVLQAPAQSDKAKAGYKVTFDSEQLEKGPDDAKGIYIKVRYAFTQDGKKVDKLDGDYRLAIEEDGKFVKSVDLSRPSVAEDISVILTLDTSGSMKEHGRMQQARLAADVFLKKLPARADCGLLLFDHVMREKIEPMLDREPLRQRIDATEPRGGTAYLDAAFESILLLSTSVRGRDRAVVLMTDGIDLNSKRSIDEVIADAKRNKVKVYTIGIGEPGKFDPVNTVLVLDHSGSMTPPADAKDNIPKIEALHQAAVRYLDAVSTAGRVSIIPFSSNVGMPWAFRDKSKIPALKAKIKKELQVGGELEPKGETALFDATYEGISLLEADNSPGKRAVVAMTDGFDNSSRRRVEEVIAYAKETKIPLYLIGFGREGEIDDITMRQMAESTGGKFYHATNKDKLIEIFEFISSDLHDDGIDEKSLRQIASDTGGQYYPAKDVNELKLVLEKVTQTIQQEPYVVYKSLNQKADGTLRRVTLKLIARGADGFDKTEDEKSGSYFRPGLVVAEMNNVLYLVLLVVIGGLIALPGLLRRSTTA